MAEYYTPDPKFYDKQIATVNKDIKALESMSYSSSDRGYVLKDGTVINESERKKRIDALKAQLKTINSDKKKYGKYGPSYGSAATQPISGTQFQRLYDSAKAIKVTDWKSALKSIQAWQAVDDFIKNNPDTRVLVSREAIVTENGRDVIRTINVVVDPTKDSTISLDLKRGLNDAIDRARTQAEVGVVEEKDVVKGRGAAATRSRQKTVTNQAVLDQRLKELDAVLAGQPIPQITTSTKIKTTVGPQGPTGPEGSIPGATGTTEAVTGLTGGVLPGAEAPTTSGVSTTTTTTGTTSGGTLQETTAGGASKKPKVDWEKAIRRYFPDQAWMLELDRTKYPDLFKLFSRAINNKMYESQTGIERFAAELKNTSFVKELETKQTVRTIKGLVGDLGFETNTFNKFLTTAANMGWEGDALKQEVYREAFRKDDTGQYVNPIAVVRAKESADWLTVKNIGRSYFSTVDDGTIESALNGTITVDDVARQQRVLAKTKYAHLSELIDQGLTLEGMSSDYKQMASQLLEKPVDQIDMTQADFEQALNFNENGTRRVLTTGEWERLLKTDSRYGYGNTEQAKKIARNLGLSLIQALGKVQ